MNPLLLFDSLGYIFGPAIFIAGICALVVCSRAESPRSVRWALIASFLPFALSVLAAPFAVVVMRNVAPNQGLPWFVICKNCLAGLVITLPPLVWALLMMRSRGRPSPVAIDK